jgi:hypothetical protein
LRQAPPFKEHERAIQVNRRHGQRVGQVGLGQGKGIRSVARQAHCAKSNEQLAKHGGCSLQRGSSAHIHDPLMCDLGFSHPTLGFAEVANVSGEQVADYLPPPVGKPSVTSGY